MDPARIKDAVAVDRPEVDRMNLKIVGASVRVDQTLLARLRDIIRHKRPNNIDAVEPYTAPDRSEWLRLTARAHGTRYHYLFSPDDNHVELHVTGEPEPAVGRISKDFADCLDLLVDEQVAA